jgi:hypothetical protein
VLICTHFHDHEMSHFFGSYALIDAYHLIAEIVATGVERTGMLADVRKLFLQRCSRELNPLLPNDTSWTVLCSASEPTPAKTFVIDMHVKSREIRDTLCARLTNVQFSFGLTKFTVARIDADSDDIRVRRLIEDAASSPTGNNNSIVFHTLSRYVLTADGVLTPQLAKRLAIEKFGSAAVFDADTRNASGDSEQFVSFFVRFTSHQSMLDALNSLQNVLYVVSGTNGTPRPLNIDLDHDGFMSDNQLIERKQKARAARFAPPPPPPPPPIQQQPSSSTVDGATLKRKIEQVDVEDGAGAQDDTTEQRTHSRRRRRKHRRSHRHHDDEAPSNNNNNNNNNNNTTTTTNTVANTAIANNVPEAAVPTQQPVVVVVDNLPEPSPTKSIVAESIVIESSSSSSSSSSSASSEKKKSKKKSREEKKLRREERRARFDKTFCVNNGTKNFVVVFCRRVLAQIEREEARERKKQMKQAYGEIEQYSRSQTHSSHPFDNKSA